MFTSNFYKVFKGIEIVQTSNEEVFFDIMVHLGTLIAVLIFFRKDVINIVKSMWHAMKTADWSEREAKLGLYIIAGTIVTICLALPINEIAEKLVYTPSIVGILLFITGFTLLYSEYKSKKIEDKKNTVDLKRHYLSDWLKVLLHFPDFLVPDGLLQPVYFLVWIGLQLQDIHFY